MKVEISGPEQSNIPDCEKILRALPEYFGIEEALVQYLEDIKSRLTFHAYIDRCIVGFLSTTRHTPGSAEIHVMGVLPKEQGKGVGSSLVKTAEWHLRNEGVRLLEVKTLGESHPDINYAKTRRFYLSQGFLPLEEILDFWGKGLPTLFMVKPLFEVVNHSTTAFKEVVREGAETN